LFVSVLHLTTIPTIRLNWLWLQYHTTLHNPSNFTPPIQSFETELVWLYHRYKPRLSKKDPLNSTQYTLPTDILNHLFDSFKLYTPIFLLHLHAPRPPLVYTNFIHLFIEIKYLDPLAPRSNTNGKGWAMPIHITHKMPNKFYTGLD
jgi:hypothetical protein